MEGLAGLAEKACSKDDGETIERVATTVGIPYEGAYGLPFQQNRYTCNKLVVALTPHKKAFDVEKALRTFEQNILKRKERPNVGYKWSYAGYVEAGIFGLIYILERNANACAVLNNLDVDAKYLDWYNIGLVWRDERLIGATDAFIESMHQCKTRFVVIILTLWTGVQVLHANILLYDTLNHVAERFDPYHDGIGSPKLLANVDRELEKFFKRAYSDFSRLVRPPKKTLFKGIQTLQEGEMDKKKHDPPGYCQPFTFLYCECRLTFPDMDPLQVRDLIIQSADQRTQTIGDFIRTYSECLQDETLLLFERYVKPRSPGERMARQLKEGFIPYLDIAVERLKRLNAVGFMPAEKQKKATF